MVLLLHHLAGDHVTLEVMQEEMEAHLQGRAEQLPAPLPFRNLVAQARLGVSLEEHEDFFRQMLGDVTEPTAPFGLLDVQGDGTGIEEARIALEPDAGAAGSGERAQAGGECGQSVSSGLGAGAGAGVGTRGRGVRHGTVRTHAGRRGRRPGAGAVHQYAAGADTDRRRGGRGGVRRMHSQLGELLRHEHASLALAQRCSGVAAPTPLFSALLNYRHSPKRSGRVSEDRRRAWKGIERAVRSRAHQLSVDPVGGRFG